MRLKDKVALVTGAASGIGRATAILLAQEGARVMCADIDGQGAERVARQIGDGGGRAAAVQVDVAQDADAQRMVQAAVERWGRIDILVNNAGVEFGLPLPQVPEAEWDRLLDINLKGVYLGCKHAIPQMMQSGGGAIVNMASVAGLRGVAMLSTYCASKGGVVLLTKALAVEWARMGIRVNCVCPGVIHTPMVERAAETQPISREEFLQRLNEGHPMGRIGQPEEVAKAVLFLASDDASFITGAALPVDGGWTAGSPLAQPERLE